MTNDDDLGKLIDTVRQFCNKERATARGGRPDRVAANQLRTIFNSLCPALSQTFQDTADVVYARRIIEYGVASRGDAMLEIIWKSYYKLGASQEDVEHLADRAANTIKKLRDQFPYQIAVQLLEAESALTTPRIQSPETIGQRQGRAKRFLQDAYDLTTKQAEILLAFCLNPNISQSMLCDDILHIAENTLKAHKKRILKALGTKTMKPAADKAKELLTQKFGDDWKQQLSDAS